MPEMGGRELADRLTQIRPDMKVLFMSGYTDNAIVHHGVLDADVPFIQKPFAPPALAQKVREVLSQSKLKTDS
jgi:FixJ family two-component response regulator